MGHSSFTSSSHFLFRLEAFIQLREKCREEYIHFEYEKWELYLMKVDVEASAAYEFYHNFPDVERRSDCEHNFSYVSHNSVVDTIWRWFL